MVNILAYSYDKSDDFNFAILHFGVVYFIFHSHTLILIYQPLLSIIWSLYITSRMLRLCLQFVFTLFTSSQSSDYKHFFKE